MSAVRIVAVSRRARGLGANATVAAAQAEVTAKIRAEGGSQADIDAATTNVEAAWNDLVTNGIGTDPSAAIDAAKQLALASFAPSGVVSQVTSLVSAVQSGNTGQIAQVFGGTLVAAAAAAGLASAGVGAAIVAGIGIVTNLVTGLFQSPPPVANICGVDYVWKPTIVVSCVGTDAPPIVAPQSADWRKFPAFNRPEDHLWWVWPDKNGNGFNGAVWPVGAASTQRTWQGPAFARYLSTHPEQTIVQRLIDAAFPVFFHLSTEVQYYIVHDPSHQNQLWNFFQAYFAAWKTNQEYALNGHNPAADWQVLRHVLQLWNRAHLPGQPAVMEPRDTIYLRTVITGANANGGTGQTDDAANGPLVPYVSMLIEEYNQNFPNEAGGAHPSITINMGPLRSVPGGTSSAGTTVAKVAGGSAIVLAASALAVTYAKGKTIDWLFGKIWDFAKKPFGK